MVDCAPNPNTSPARCVSQITPEWQAVVNAERDVAQSQQLTYIDDHLFFCTTDGYCPSFVGHTPVRVDGAHITDAYATLLGNYLSPLLAAAAT